MASLQLQFLEGRLKQWVFRAVGLGLLFSCIYCTTSQSTTTPNPTPQYGAPEDPNSSQVEVINEPFTIGKDTAR